MSIENSELKVYRAAVNDDTSSNGGRMTTTLEADNLYNSVWKNITGGQRSTGATQYRKFAYKADNAANIAMQNVRVGMEFPTAGPDRIFCFAGTQTDIQSGISSPTLYGAAALNANVSTGATTITVLLEDPATTIFRNGDLIRISDMASVTGAGNEEFVRVSGTPTIVSSVATITLATPLVNGYSASATYVSSLIEFGDVAAGVVGTPTVTSAAGTFDKTKLTVQNIGGLYQVLTFTFSSATAFTCSGDTLGSLGSGTISGTFAPTNPAFGSAYFSLLSSAWGGTFAAGDTVVVTITPCSVMWWEKRVVPAGAGTIPTQTTYRMIFAESAG